MTIPVPPRIVDQFRRLAALDDASFDRLAAATEASSPTVARGRLIREVVEKSGLEPDLVEAILDAAITASTIAARDGYHPGNVAAALRLPAEGFDRDDFNARLTRIVTSSAVVLTAKAFDLAVADERYMLYTKIVTDVRPIFRATADSDGATDPAAAIIKHSLRIEFLENGEARTFYVSLDRFDIRRLQEDLNRAEAKAEALEQSIGAAGFLVLDVESDEDE